MINRIPRTHLSRDPSAHNSLPALHQVCDRCVYLDGDLMDGFAHRSVCRLKIVCVSVSVCFSSFTGQNVQKDLRLSKIVHSDHAGSYTTSTGDLQS